MRRADLTRLIAAMLGLVLFIMATPWISLWITPGDVNLPVVVRLW